MVRQRRISWCAAALLTSLSTLGQSPSAQVPGWAFTASSDVVDAGQSTTLSFSAATTDMHSVSINGLRPSWTCGVDSCTGTLSVTPFFTTTYELRSMTAAGVPWPALTVVVTVIPAPPQPLLPALDPSQTGDIATLPLLSQANLVYEGAFTLPWNDGTGRVGAFSDGQPDTYSFRYGGKGIGFDKARGSLFVSGEEKNLKVAEVSIPDVRIAPTPEDLATASVLQPLADPTDGRYRLAYPGGLTWEYGRWGQFLPYQDKLLVSAYHYYDGSWIQNASHFVSSLNLSRPDDAIGPFKIGGLTLEGYVSDAEIQAAVASNKRPPTTTGFTSGYMGEIPLPWQTALGGKVIAGQAGVSIVGRTSFGPGAFAFDPDTLIGDQVPTPLVYYPLKFPALGPWGGPAAPESRLPPNPVFNGTTQVNGVVFPVNTRTVIFLGRHGLGAFCYGATCRPDECKMAKCTQRNHAPPYVYYAWLYDAAEFLKVRRGEINPWDVKPYSVFALDLPFRESEAFLKGAAYDPATGRIFVSQDRLNEPIIHVYRIR